MNLFLSPFIHIQTDYNAFLETLTFWDRIKLCLQMKCKYRCMGVYLIPPTFPADLDIIRYEFPA